MLNKIEKGIEKAQKFLSNKLLRKAARKVITAAAKTMQITFEAYAEACGMVARKPDTLLCLADKGLDVAVEAVEAFGKVKWAKTEKAVEALVEAAKAEFGPLAKLVSDFEEAAEEGAEATADAVEELEKEWKKARKAA